MWKWAAWLLLLVVSFSVMEGYSLYDNTATLSRFVWTITANFPPFPWIAGFLSGFLVCHFWWGGIVPFAPAAMAKKGNSTTALLLLIILAVIGMMGFVGAAMTQAAQEAVTTVPGVMVTTTGPVASETTISVGTITGQIMLVIWTAFGGVMVYYGSIALQKLAVHFGVQISEGQRVEYADHVLHAINLVAPKAAQEFADKGQIEIKNAAVGYAIEYMRTHHDELGKAIGIDASQSLGKEQIKAQIETAIADPTVPTPKVLDPVKPANLTVS